MSPDIRTNKPRMCLKNKMKSAWQEQETFRGEIDDTEG